MASMNAREFAQTIGEILFHHNGYIALSGREVLKKIIKRFRDELVAVNDSDDFTDEEFYKLCDPNNILRLYMSDSPATIESNKLN